jgi:hypothetical protein
LSPGQTKRGRDLQAIGVVREIRGAAFKCVNALPQKLLNALPKERFSNKAAKQKSAAVGRFLNPNFSQRGSGAAPM